MAMLKRILIAVAAIVVVFVAVVAMQPSEFRVARTATIEFLRPSTATNTTECTFYRAPDFLGHRIGL
jgi:hypothetical protein